MLKVSREKFVGNACLAYMKRQAVCALCVLIRDRLSEKLSRICKNHDTDASNSAKKEEGLKEAFLLKLSVAV